MSTFGARKSGNFPKKWDILSGVQYNMREIHSSVKRATDFDASLEEKQKAFEEIVRQYQDIAYHYAYVRLKDVHLAQDAVQEAFITAWQTLKNLRNPEAFFSWFRRVVWTQCDLLRRGKHVSMEPLETALDVSSSEPDPHTQAEKQELQEHLLNAIQKLPEHERITTSLFYVDSHSLREIADVLDIQDVTVRTRLHSARQRLRGWLMKADSELYSEYSSCLMPHTVI